MSRTLHTVNLALLNDQARLPTVAHVLIAVAVVVTKWDRYRRTRKELKTLDPHLLNDIGLTARAASIEARKPFWQE